MDIKNLVDKLNKEKEKLDKIKSNEKNYTISKKDSDDNLKLDSIENIDNCTLDSIEESSINTNVEIENINCEIEASNEIVEENIEQISSDDSDVIGENESLSSNDEITALVTVKEHQLIVAKNIFKKSIRISLKSFLISISLSFLNLFI